MLCTVLRCGSHTLTQTQTQTPTHRTRSNTPHRGCGGRTDRTWSAAAAALAFDEQQSLCARTVNKTTWKTACKTYLYLLSKCYLQKITAAVYKTIIIGMCRPSRRGSRCRCRRCRRSQLAISCVAWQRIGGGGSGTCGVVASVLSKAQLLCAFVRSRTSKTICSTVRRCRCVRVLALVCSSVVLQHVMLYGLWDACAVAVSMHV